MNRKNPYSQTHLQTEARTPPLETPIAEAAHMGTRIDGMGAVLDMLIAADAEFRNSLLKRIAAQNPRLAATLRARLSDKV